MRLFVLPKAPILGYGLGIGTNARRKFLTGRSGFLLTEGEWSRLLLEMDPSLELPTWVAVFFGPVDRITLSAIGPARNILPILLSAPASSHGLRAIWPAHHSGFRRFHDGLRLGGYKQRNNTCGGRMTNVLPRAIAFGS